MIKISLSFFLTTLTVLADDIEKDNSGDDAKEEDSPPSSPILVAPKQLHPKERDGADSEFHEQPLEWGGGGWLVYGW